MAEPDSQEEGPEIGSKGIFSLILKTQVNSESMQVGKAPQGCA